MSTHRRGTVDVRSPSRAIIIRDTSRRWIRMDNSDPVITCPIQNRCQRKTWQERENVIENATVCREGAWRGWAGIGSACAGKTGESGAAIYYSDTRARSLARCFYDPPYFLPWRLPNCWIRKIDSAKCCLTKTESSPDAAECAGATPINRASLAVNYLIKLARARAGYRDVRYLDHRARKCDRGVSRWIDRRLAGEQQEKSMQSSRNNWIALIITFFAIGTIRNVDFMEMRRRIRLWSVKSAWTATDKKSPPLPRPKKKYLTHRGVCFFSGGFIQKRVEIKHNENAIEKQYRNATANQWNEMKIHVCVPITTGCTISMYNLLKQWSWKKDTIEGKSFSELLKRISQSI